MPIDRSFLEAMFLSLQVNLYGKAHARSREGESLGLILQDIADYRGEGFYGLWDQIVGDFLDRPPDQVAFNEQMRQYLSGRARLPIGLPKGMHMLGEFSVLTRPPGVKSGRAPGLHWEEANSLVPESLKVKLDQVNIESFAIERAAIPFCRKDTYLWHLSIPASTDADGQADAFAITAESLEEIIMLDWTNEPLYRLNDLRLFRFGQSLDIYARCFFHLVRGKAGVFTILNDEWDVDHLVPWNVSEDTAETIRADKAFVMEKIEPLWEKGVSTSGETLLRGTILFKNALFQSDIAIHPTGQVRLDNENLIKEGLEVNSSASTEGGEG